MSITRDDVAWARILRSRLVKPLGSPVEVARASIGVQSQFVPPTGLAIRNRARGDFTATSLHDELHVHKRLLRLWGQRNTVHVYDIVDWETIVSVSSAIPSYRERLVDRIGRSEAELERALDRVSVVLRGVERASRADLSKDPELAEWFQLGNILMMDVVRRGEACHAGLVSGKSHFAHREVWSPGMSWDPPTADQAGRALARRYFESYGPATVRDFTFWTGARAADARRWVASLGEELSEVRVEGAPPITLLRLAGGSDRGDAPPRSAWPTRLLHRFDPLLLAHKDKSWIVADEHYKAVWRKAGYVEAVIFRRGRIAGTWGYEKKARGVDIWLAPFEALPKKERRVWEREAQRAAGYFEAPLLKLSVG